ncbi:DNA-binding protein Fis [Aidingimonas halophila]|uniref:Putative Fis-like DNA-binding protein n=2 Tax=Aidingimonas halophila TaxID=574349 RepID=A0A1H3AVW5_9GAMM|nr:DNA-binding transcriptional regulator Fis [Aidingimonas halophila]GHC25452.1 putative Fis-like DNA-binding protein [Aidingimonas halophila]SDX33745.1 DNA-binding protein Fis [Aidingimonas halophila]
MNSRQATTSEQSVNGSQDALDPGTTMDAPTVSADSQEQPLREAVDTAMRRYFEHLDGETVTDLYAMVLAEVESPLLARVLEYADGNQTRAAEILGLNRGTLRKKLKYYELI